jgi:uncharacterized protein (DUF927 family)
MTTRKHNPLDDVIIVGEGFDEFKERYLKVKVIGSNRELPPYSMTDLLEPKRLYVDLGNAGCKLLSAKSQRSLLEKLQGYQQSGPTKFTVVTRLGAFREFFVQPRTIVGQPTVPVELASTSLNSEMLDKYRCRGTLVDWQQRIGALCVSNSRLMFAASLACTGPILSLVKGPRNGGFQISGRAESGKTTMAMVAGSVWGCHRDHHRRDKGFAESWNTTGNQLEETARVHSDTVLVTDETGLAGKTDVERARAVLDGVFRLSEGTKKGRYTESVVAAWRFYFLSTSNFTLDELAEAGGVTMDDQHRGRLVDIGLPTGPGTFGIYEDLHDYSDGAALTDAIKARCRSVFGTPGLRLVQKLYKDKASRSAAKVFVSAKRDVYINRVRRKTATKGLKPLERATARFATVYAAGCLASRYGIFTWSRKELLAAILSCQLDGLVAVRRRIDPITTLRQRLITYLVDNRKRFLDLNTNGLLTKAHSPASVPGYCHRYRGEKWLYLMSDQLKAVIGNDKAAARKLKDQLVEQGMMDRSGKRMQVQRPIFKAKSNKGYRWVHAFRATLLDSSIEVPRRRALHMNK